MSNFHDRLEAKIKEAGISRRKLSLEIGQGQSYIANLMLNRSDPGFETILRICTILKTDPNELAGVSPSVSLTSTSMAPNDVDQIAEKVYSKLAQDAWIAQKPRQMRPRVDEIIEWWDTQNGLLQNFDQIAESVDLFDLPNETSQHISPYKMGRESLATRAFGIEDADNLRRVLEGFDPQFNETLVLSHRSSSLGKIVHSVEDLDVGVAGKGRVQVKYQRLLLKVHDISGREFILNFAQPFGPFK